MPSDGEGEVQIVLGKVPQLLTGNVVRGPFWQIGERQLLFHIPRVAGFYIADGVKIVLSPEQNSDMDTVRLYLLGTALGALLHQRGILPLHGSAVSVDGMGKIFLGDCGQGKSTLAAALRMKGFAVLCDDLAAVAIDESGKPWILPGYPRQKLDPASMRELGINCEGLKPVSVERNKYQLPLDRDFCPYPVPLDTIYELTVSDDSEIALSSLNGIEKIEVVLNQTYREALLDGFGYRADHFQKCLAVSEKINMFRLHRPEAGNTATAQAEILAEIWSNQPSAGGRKGNQFG